MRVYNRAIGELLMRSASGEPSGYYPMESNGVWVQSELPAPCKCPVVVPAALSVCQPLGHGGCNEDENEIEGCVKKCRKKRGRNFWKCFADCVGSKIVDKAIDDLLSELCIKNFCKVFPCLPQCQKGNPCDIQNPSEVDCEDCCDVEWACCVANIKGGWRLSLKGFFEWNECYAERVDCYTKCN